jgi:hypothetical protein
MDREQGIKLMQVFVMRCAQNSTGIRGFAATPVHGAPLRGGS